MADSKNSKKYYDRTYYLENVDGFDLWDHFDGTRSYLHPRFKRNIELMELKITDTLMDVGCGRGEICIFHASQGGQALGVDYSHDAIKLAEKKCRELQVEVGFMCESFEIMESLAPESIDVVYASEFIEHISLDEAKSFIRLTHRILKKSGRIVLHTYPNTLQRTYGYPISRILAKVRGRSLPKIQTDMLTEHYLKYHLNEQSLFSLRKLVASHFIVSKSGYDDFVDKESIFARLLKNSVVGHLFRRDIFVVGVKR